MTDIFIDNEEKNIILSFEKWEFIPVKNFNDRKKVLEESFNYTIEKREPIKIDILKSDTYKLKTMAIQEWIPYDAFLSWLIHKFSVWKLIAKN